MRQPLRQTRARFRKRKGDRHEPWPVPDGPAQSLDQLTKAENFVSTGLERPADSARLVEILVVASATSSTCIGWKRVRPPSIKGIAGEARASWANRVKK